MNTKTNPTPAAVTVLNAKQLHDEMLSAMCRIFSKGASDLGNFTPSVESLEYFVEGNYALFSSNETSMDTLVVNGDNQIIAKIHINKISIENDLKNREVLKPDYKSFYYDMAAYKNLVTRVVGPTKSKANLVVHKELMDYDMGVVNPNGIQLLEHVTVADAFNMLDHIKVLTGLPLSTISDEEERGRLEEYLGKGNSIIVGFTMYRPVAK